MGYRSSARLCAASAFVLALLAAGVRPAAAAPVPCDTENPCTAGTCLENGTCEAVAANDGAPCETFEACVVGECSGGLCQGSPAPDGTACETVEPCREKNGECSEGECTSDALANDSPCRQDVIGPCVTGTCTTFSNFSFCEFVFKCGDDFDACALNCNPLTGDCETFPTHICDNACTTATCEPDGEFDYTCTDRENRPQHSACDNGNTCDGQDECLSGECTGTGTTDEECGDGSVGGAEQCDDGDTVFASGDACDADCTRVPCGKPTNSSGSLPKASDALFALKAAVKSASCDVEVCDVNDNGTVTASDALLILKKAVGQPVTLDCPA